MLTASNNAVLIIAAFLWGLSPLCAAGTYKWGDEEGNIHFSDEAPDDTVPQAIEIKKHSVKTDATESYKTDENLAKVKDHCGKLILDQQSQRILATHHILGKWQFYAQSKCLDQDVQPSNGFKYNWEFKSATTVEMSLGRTRSSATYQIKNNIIYMDNLAKTTMVLIRQESHQLVWAHMLGNSFEGYYYVRRN